MVHQRAEKAPVPHSETHRGDLNAVEPIGFPLPELVGANDESAHTNSGPRPRSPGRFSPPDYLAGSDRFPTNYRRGPPPSPVSQITMSGRGSRGPRGSRIGPRSAINKSVTRPRGRGRGTSQTLPLPNQSGNMPASVSAELVNIVARGFPAGTRVLHDPYVVVATTDDASHMGEFGLLPSDFRRELLQTTSWPIPVSEPLGQPFDHPDFSLYSSWIRWDSHRLAAIPHNPPKRDEETRHRPGRHSCFLHRAHHSPFRYFIPPTIPGDLPHLRSDIEFLYFRGLVDVLSSAGPSPDWLKLGLDLVAFESPYDRIHWLDRKGWGEGAASEARIRHRNSLVKTMHGYHLIEYFSQSTEGRRQWYVQQPGWWNEYKALQWLSVTTPSVLA
ncbi:hypothetical protein BWQ96_00644 [Gracilariopsis chorda]|uniref:Uncharacterized protein n=1 Tax=Gracilariopsis chorda TaxID=448386 RepID=A0A2V3J5C6_9FLOR|nr:hypothetical protein BWQ96_00644 [Gracilariopsis chorda]|eukprot:PXF49574.1 hypothetical protein BWQ96_00644 [Gracilariopsis chorda]